MKRLPGAIFIVDPHRERIARDRGEQARDPGRRHRRHERRPRRARLHHPGQRRRDPGDPAAVHARRRRRHRGRPASAPPARHASPSRRADADARAEYDEAAGAPTSSSPPSPAARRCRFEPDADDDDLLPGDRAARAEPPSPRPPPRRPPRRSPPSSPARRPRRPRTPAGPRPADAARRRRPTAEPPNTTTARRPRPRRARTGARTSMADITAEAVKELRERTGAGFMDCKQRPRRRPTATSTRPSRCCASRASPRPRRRPAATPARASSRATSTPAAASACSSRSTARPTSSPAPTSSRSSSATSRSRSPGSPRCTSTSTRSRPTSSRPRRPSSWPTRRVQKKPENIREQIVEGQLKKWYRGGLPLRAAVPRRGAHRPRADHREDRHDRREHPGPPLHPLRARGGAVSDAGDAAAGRATPAARPLPPDPAQAVRRGAPRRPPVRRRPGVLRVHRRARSREVHALGVQVGIVVGGGNIFRGLAASAQRHGPRDRRLHRHAGDGHERPRPPGRPRAGRRARPGS